MHRRIAGFALLEVLVALCVITVGLVGLAGTLGPIAKLAGQGRARGRAASALASRADLLRAELLSAAPACVAPASGSQQSPDGVAESWTGSVVGPSVQVQIIAGTDTLISRFPCP